MSNIRMSNLSNLSTLSPTFSATKPKKIQIELVEVKVSKSLDTLDTLDTNTVNKCLCGRVFTTLEDLQAHQRSCGIAVSFCVKDWIPIRKHEK